MIQKILQLFIGSKFERDQKKLTPIIQKVNDYENPFQQLNNQQVTDKTLEFKERLHNGETLNDILPEAFANVREAAKRTLKMRHYDVQLMGGLVLHQGKIAEMKTGEGKTLTSTLPVYLHALVEKGVHLVTVNDYLAKRDAEWMKPVYQILGISVGFVQSNMNHEERKQAYSCDITYGTNNEFGFDYLRDNMVTHQEFKVQRDHYFAIVDEVDSVLIDEARTPLIISGPAEQNVELYKHVDNIIPNLKLEEDFELDEKTKNVLITELGISKVEKLLKLENLYAPENTEIVHHVHQSLKAHHLFSKEVDYVVQNGELIIVDEFTGRLMEGRRYSDGLHQALEAKEKINVKSENQTLASITFQNYFRMYDILSGMTGTADTEAEEFHKIYGLDVVVLPTNQALTRIDLSDKIYRTKEEKYNAIIQEIKDANKKKQPVLVGTTSIAASELISQKLEKHNISHSVLNAKMHEKEANIIKNAGSLGAITIATNMAGRGTDIVLEEGVLDVGGLYIIGSERHESRRIDNQLRGRSGRQGDIGKSLFFLSLEDDLMRIFMSDRMGSIMQRLGMQEGEAIEHKMVTNAIERAQKRVEGHNFDVRKHLLQYDDIMNKQRQFIYKMRNQVLEKQELNELLLDFIQTLVQEKVDIYINVLQADPENLEFYDWVEDCIQIQRDALQKQIPRVVSSQKDSVVQKVISLFQLQYKKQQDCTKPETFILIQQNILLQVIDQKWKEHLHALDHLREGMWTMGYAEKNPLIEYRFQSFELFKALVSEIKHETIAFLFKIPTDILRNTTQEQQESKKEYVPPQGKAIHRSNDSYGVGTSIQTKPEDAIQAFQGSGGGLLENKNQLNQEKTKSAGGSTKRKKIKRKR